MIELNKIYNEDCLEGMQRIPDNSIDCIICDLPYGIINCKWDNIIHLESLWEQYNRIIKLNGVIALFGTEPFSSRLRMSNIKHYKYDWIWKKETCTGFQHAKNMPLKDFEIISIFSKGSIGHSSLLGEKRMRYNPQGIIRINKISKTTKNKWSTIAGSRPSHKDYFLTEYSNYPKMVLNYKSDKNKFHPTQKPVALIEYLVYTYTNKGETVLDNCMGSGTTAVACINTGRNYIGFETDKKYYDLSVQRINSISNQLFPIK